MGTEELELAPLLARRELWLLLSAAAVDPYHRQRFDLLRDPAFCHRGVEAAALLAAEHAGIELGPGEADPQGLSPAHLFADLDAEAETLEATYRRLFGLTAVSPQCPPCEIEYEPNPDIAYRAQRLADVAGFYQAFGMQNAPRAGERVDHLAVEAEFLYLLLAKEAFALDQGEHEGAAICREARRKFFEEHVGWWLPAFSWALSRVAPPGYYRTLAELIAALSAVERVSLGLPAFRGRVRPSPSSVDDAPAACSACASGEPGAG